MEGRRIFAELTVEDNLRTGAHTVHDKQAITGAHERVMDLFPVLKPRQRDTAGYLSGGEQQMLAIGRALMASETDGDPFVGRTHATYESIVFVLVVANHHTSTGGAYELLSLLRFPPLAGHMAYARYGSVGALQADVILSSPAQATG